MKNFSYDLELISNRELSGEDFEPIEKILKDNNISHGFIQIYSCFGGGEKIIVDLVDSNIVCEDDPTLDTLTVKKLNWPDWVEDYQLIYADWALESESEETLSKSGIILGKRFNIKYKE